MQASGAGVIDQLAKTSILGTDDEFAVQFAQAYMESRGYLKGPDTQRQIHGVAAWVLLALHNERGQLADPVGAAYPLLIRYGLRLAELNRSLASADITQIIQDYKDVQEAAQNVSLRELVIARVTTRMALIPLTAEKDDPKWSTASEVGGAPSVDFILEQAKMSTRMTVNLGVTSVTGTGLDTELWTKLFTSMKTSGSLFMSWDDFKKSDWQVAPGVGGFGGTRKDIFSGDAQNVKEGVDTGADDDEW